MYPMKMGRRSKKGRILKMRHNLAMKQRYVTNVVYNETKTEKPEVLEEVKMRQELEDRLEVTRLELKFIRKMRREKLWVLNEIQSDPSWTKAMDDQEGDSPFEEIYHHFVTTEEFMISQQECPEVEESVNAYIRKQVQMRQKTGVPVDSDEITVEVMEIMNNVYKEFLSVHMKYLDDLIERYTDKLEVKKLEKEFYIMAVDDRRKQLEKAKKLREEKQAAEERMKEQEVVEVAEDVEAEDVEAEDVEAEDVEAEEVEEEVEEPEVEETEVEAPEAEEPEAEEPEAGKPEVEKAEAEKVEVGEPEAEEPKVEEPEEAEEVIEKEDKKMEEGEKENSPIATQ